MQKKYLRLGGLLGLICFLAVITVIVGNGLTLKTRQLKVPALPPKNPAPAQEMAQRLAAAIQIETISRKNHINPNFKLLEALLKKSFPLLAQKLTLRLINQHGLLLHFPGKNPQEPMVLLLAHLDVVPVESPSVWKHPPFSGKMTGGYIWGRGAIDDKQSALAILEATEALLRQGQRPERSVYIALGYDEEIGGAQGAAYLAKALKKQGIECGFSLDEGLAIVPGSMIGMKPPVALIGLSEKGYLSVELTATQAGGHASMPPKETAVGILASALNRLQNSPFPARLGSSSREMFSWLAPEMGGASKWALANLWLFEPLLLKQLSGKPATNALIRTTVAPTMMQGSPQENILPAEAKAVLNLRLLPGDSQSKALAYLKQVTADPRIKIQARSGFSSEAAPESDSQSADFTLLHRTIRQVFPEVVVAPSLVLAGTDSRHYQTLCKNQYRFQPVYLSAEDLKRVHGANERISIDAHAQAARFYLQLLKQL
ncbi:MAG: M20 family peptidase [Candidatus Sericytochromatia bacterium]